MATISVLDLIKENNELKVENILLKNEVEKLKRHYDSTLYVKNDVSEKNKELKDEIEFLKNTNKFLRQRNTELRQKTWYSVYEENLKLNQELEKYKALANGYEKGISEMFNHLTKEVKKFNENR